MCVYTYIFIFHQKLNFAKNVTYDLLAFSRRIKYTTYILSYEVKHDDFMTEQFV